MILVLPSAERVKVGKPRASGDDPTNVIIVNRFGG